MFSACPVCWGSRWAPSVLSPPLPAAWGRGRSVFTCHQRVVTCPKAPQASEQQSRGSNPEPMKAVPKHMRVNRRATPEGPAQGTALLSPCLPEQLAQGWQCQHFPNRAPFSLTATATHPLTPTSLLIKSLFFFLLAISHGVQNFPQMGIEAASLAVKCRVSTTRPPGKTSAHTFLSWGIASMTRCWKAPPLCSWQAGAAFG